MATMSAAEFGSWRPSGDAPLVLAMERGMRTAARIGWGVLIVGSWTVVYSIIGIVRLAAGLEDAPHGVAGVVGVTILGLVIVATGLWFTVTAHYVRKVTVEIGPRGIALLPGEDFIYWEELSRVGVDVEAVRRVQPTRPLATRTSVRVIIALLPWPGAFSARDLPDMTLPKPPPPYTHSVVVPQPGFGSDGRNIPVVRDLDAALRHFAPGIYAGVDERFSQRGFG